MGLLLPVTADDLRPTMFALEDRFYPEPGHQWDAGVDLKIRVEEPKSVFSLLSTAKSYGPSGNILIDGKSYGPRDKIEEKRPDLLMANPNALLLRPLEGILVGTGLFVWLPSLSKFGPYVPALEIRPRSGLGGKYKLIISNTPGTIDKGYSNELKVALYNLNNCAHILTDGARCAQMVYEIVVDQGEVGYNRAPSLEDFKALFDESTRGNQGIGSSGV